MMGRRTWIGRGMVVVAAALLAFGAAGCHRARSYSQATPDDVVKTAVEMVKNGDARRLGDLIYADSAEMRVFLDRLGDLFGHMQTLAVAVSTKFPADIEELKRKAAEAAAQGKVEPLLGAVAGAASGRGRRGPSAALGGMDEEQVLDLINRLFADPYGWLERNSARLSTLKSSDDSAAVMLDGEPLIPVVGLPLRLENGKWYISLPTNFPGIADVMPRGREQWSILCSVVKVVDRTVMEMSSDVKSGQVASVDALGKKAREKALLPAAIAFAAYGKEMEVRTRVDRRVKLFQSREREWAKNRGPGDEAEAKVSPKLVSVLTRLAPAKIEPMVRKNKPQPFDRMSNTEFESLAASWLAEVGLAINLEGGLTPGDVDAEIVRWEAGRARAGNVVSAKKTR